MNLLPEQIRPFVSFKIGSSETLKRGCNHVVVTYPDYIVGGESEVNVARAKFLNDDRFHHEPVDMFLRQGFSGNRKDINELKKALNDAGFVEGKY